MNCMIGPSEERKGALLTVVRWGLLSEQQDTLLEDNPLESANCKAHLRVAALYAVQGMQEMLLKEECTHMIKHPETAVNDFLEFLKVCIPSLAYPCV